MQTDVEEEIAALQYLSIERLKERYQELCGEETRSRNRKYLVRKLAWRMQALAEGDLGRKRGQPFNEHCTAHAEFEASSAL